MSRICDQDNCNKSKSVLSDINYLYQPDKICGLQTQVILFKALAQVSADINLKLDDVYKKINTYYLNFAIDNHLSDICDANIEIVNMEASHFDWVEKTAVVNKVCSIIKGEVTFMDVVL